MTLILSYLVLSYVDTAHRLPYELWQLDDSKCSEWIVLIFGAHIASASALSLWPFKYEVRYAWLQIQGISAVVGKAHFSFFRIIFFIMLSSYNSLNRASGLYFVLL